MPTRREFGFPAVVAALLIAGTPAAAVGDDRVLKVTRDFNAEQLGPLAPISHHTWTDDQKHAAGEYSQLEIVDDSASRSRCGRIKISDRLPWGARTEYRVLTIGPDYLPPEADAVRMRVRVVSGKFELRVGSPTVYFGHSDILSESREVTASADGAWQTIEFSLHDGLTRNFRRARFGRESPVIYYTRWIQEPLYLFAGRSSAGEMLIDQVELIARGTGRDYPEFPGDEIKQVAPIADFENAADLERTFTFFQEPIDFHREPYLVRPDWRPPQLQRASDGRGDGIKGGKYSLRFEQQGTEETCFAGIRVDGTAAANAVALVVRADHAGGASEVVVDFLAYAAPAKKSASFPWASFEPPGSWQGSPMAFTYYLSEDRTHETDYAFYHTRRTLPNGRWTTLVLPLADFICAYGRGEAAALFREQRPLAGDALLALGWTAPFGARRNKTVLLIDGISLVRVPGDAEQHRSFPQKPVVTPASRP